MATKTFKIGEYAKGGTIKVTTTKNTINISVINMFGNGEEIDSHQETITEHDFIKCDSIERRISNFLHDITTSYYSGKIMAWIKDKTGLKFFWC